MHGERAIIEIKMRNKKNMVSSLHKNRGNTTKTLNNSHSKEIRRALGQLSEFLQQNKKELEEIDEKIQEEQRIADDDSI